MVSAVSMHACKITELRYDSVSSSLHSCRTGSVLLTLLPVTPHHLVSTCLGVVCQCV